MNTRMQLARENVDDRKMIRKRKHMLQIKTIE